MRSRTSTASIAIKTSSVFAAIALAFALNAMETARALNEANSSATSSATVLQELPATGR